MGSILDELDESWTGRRLNAESKDGKEYWVYQKLSSTQICEYVLAYD